MCKIVGYIRCSSMLIYSFDRLVIISVSITSKLIYVIHYLYRYYCDSCRRCQNGIEVIKLKSPFLR